MWIEAKFSSKKYSQITAICYTIQGNKHCKQTSFLKTIMTNNKFTFSANTKMSNYRSQLFHKSRNFTENCERTDQHSTLSHYWSLRFHGMLFNETVYRTCMLLFFNFSSPNHARLMIRNFQLQWNISAKKNNNATL